jgi:hypothetical protein
MMVNKPTRLGSILIVVLLVLMPVQQLSASVAILNVQSGPGGKPTTRSVTKETVTGDRFETNEKEIQQVLLSDGTSLTVGPRSAMVIETFTYDPQTQSGQLNVRLERGQFRIVGGLLNNTGNIVVQTPSGKLDLDNASVFVEVQENGSTRASLLYGKSLKMTTNGKSEAVERPAFEVVSTDANQPPKSPSHQDPKTVAADALALNSQLLLGEEGGGGVGDPGGQGTAVLASLSATGNETPFGTPQLPPPPPPPEPPFTRPGLITAALNPSTGFGPGGPISPANITGEEPSQANGDQHILAQARENARFDKDNNFIEPIREKGRTTNRLFNSSSPFTQALVPNQKPPAPEADTAAFIGASSAPHAADTNLQYVFFLNLGANRPLSLAIDGGTDLNSLLSDFQSNIRDPNGHPQFNQQSPFILLDIDQLPAPNKVFKRDIKTILDQAVGSGSTFRDATHFELLQAGFLQTQEEVNAIDSNFNGQTVPFVTRAADNFLLLEVRPGKIIGGEPVLDTESTTRYLFATGDIDSRSSNFAKAFSVDRFFISAGLENFEQKDQGRTVADGIRAFSRSETGLGLKLADTGLLVVNPGRESLAAKSTLLHADFGLEGTGSGQQSTISVTLGKVDYKITPCIGCEFPQSVEAVVDGQTIGSSHGTIAGVNGATVGFSSPIRSTAAGGGNPALNREGYAGYFVLENYDPTPQDPGEAPLMGGTEKPLGGSGNDQTYAYLRLATATGSSQPTLRNESTLNGWMGGLAEFENGSSIGLTQIDSGDIPDNVTIQTSPANNTVKATFSLQGQVAGQFTTFNLGGLNVDGTSAFVDDNRFAARSSNNGSGVAMVSADLFRDANGNLPPSLNRPDGTSIPQYEHLKWGFFFGDTKTTPGAREHVNLGTWIAGKIPTGDSLGLRGAASYSGHSIGNVFNNGSLYTAVGSFNNQWDFDKRTGTVDMNFDTTAYKGTTAIRGNTFNFDGTLSATGRTGQLQGSFVAPVNPMPAAVMGGFSIKETPGNTTYRAAGTFGAEQKK